MGKYQFIKRSRIKSEFNADEMGTWGPGQVLQTLMC